MKLSQFKFKLPEELIAKYPSPLRDDCRMMVLHRTTGDIEHKQFNDILDYYNEKDLFVFNDTKVFPARLYGNKEKTGARIEVFLLRELNRDLRFWDVLVDPARKIRIGNKLYFGEDNSIVAVIVLSAVLAAGGVVAFSANKKSAERYSVEKRAKRLKQIAHDLVVSDAYKDLKRDEAARAARTKASSLDASQKVISLIWKFCYFLVVAIETFALAVGTDFFGFSLQMWYAFIPAAVFVVCQLVHCAKESRRCYFDLAAKIL